jgi:hypothetical protein
MKKGLDSLVSVIGLAILVISLIVLSILYIRVVEENTALKYQLNNTYDRSETKALCNATGFCRDFVLYYSNNSLVSILPTNYTLQLTQ